MSPAKQTLIVTIDMSGKTDAQIMETMDRMFALPESIDKLLKYNLISMAQEDVIAGIHAVIDIVLRERESSQ